MNTFIKTIFLSAIIINLHGTSSSKRNFLEANCSGEDFQNKNLSGLNFTYARCIGTNFSHADLTFTNFSGGNLTGSNLSYANLDNAQFRRTNLEKVTLVGAILRRVDLSQTKGLTMKQLNSANLCVTQLPEYLADSIDPDTTIRNHRGILESYAQCRHLMHAPKKD